MFLRLVVNNIQFLCQNGLPLRGHEQKSGLLYELMKLRSAESDFLKSCVSNPRLSYLSPDVQNEIVKLLAHSIQRKVAEDIRQAGYFCIIADGTTDITQREQLSVIIRFVTAEYEVEESFLGLINLDSSTGEAIANAIKDVLLRLNVDILNCRSQVYDGAANMRGKRSGVYARIQEVVPEAIYIH